MGPNTICKHSTLDRSISETTKVLNKWKLLWTIGRGRKRPRKKEEKGERKRRKEEKGMKSLPMHLDTQCSVILTKIIMSTVMNFLEYILKDFFKEFLKILKNFRKLIIDFNQQTLDVRYFFLLFIFVSFSLSLSFLIYHRPGITSWLCSLGQII